MSAREFAIHERTSSSKPIAMYSRHNTDARMVADLREWRANNPEADPIPLGGEELDALLRVTEDWRVLGGLIPGLIPVEWVRVGDVIQDFAPVSRVDRGNMTVTIHHGPHVVRRFDKRQDWVYVIRGAEHAEEIKERLCSEHSIAAARIENRRRYSGQVEPAPSRYYEPALYRAWCERADAWAAEEAERSTR